MVLSGHPYAVSGTGALAESCQNCNVCCLFLNLFDRGAQWPLAILLSSTFRFAGVAARGGGLFRIDAEVLCWPVTSAAEPLRNTWQLELCSSYY